MPARKCYQDAVKHLKQQGWFVIHSTWWNHFAKCSQDLGGIFDAVILRTGQIVGMQATDHTSRSKHRTKILASEVYAKWREAGGRVLLITFGNVGMERKRKVTVYEEWIE